MRLYATPSDREERRDEEHVGPLPKRLAGQQDERKHAAEEDLGREGHAEPSGEGSGELVADRHVSEAKHEVDEERPERDLSDRGEPRDLERAAPPLRDPHVDEDHERGAGRDRRQEEGDGHHGRPPLRGEHVRHQQVQGAERALVHGRQRDGGDREHDRLGPLVPRARKIQARAPKTTAVARA